MTHGVFKEDREGRWEPTRLTYSHDALVDMILAKPQATNAELGAAFGRTGQWVSLVKNSGLFRERLALRQAELVDPLLRASVEERFEMVTSRALEILSEKLAAPAPAIPDNLVLAAAQLGAKAMGVGGFSTKPPPPPEAPKTDRIGLLAERLLNLNRGPTLDVEARVISVSS